METGRKRKKIPTASKRTSYTNVSGPDLIKQFQKLHAQCTAIVMTLGTQREDRPRRGRLRQQAASLGRGLQDVARATIKHPASKPRSDPRVPEVITEEEFVGEVRKCIWDWLGQFQSTETMDPHQRLAFLRRRMWLRGRRLELLSQTRMVDRDKLLRIVALADG